MDVVGFGWSDGFSIIKLLDIVHLEDEQNSFEVQPPHPFVLTVLQPLETSHSFSYLFIPSSWRL